MTDLAVTVKPDWGIEENPQEPSSGAGDSVWPSRLGGVREDHSGRADQAAACKSASHASPQQASAWQREGLHSSPQCSPSTTTSHNGPTLPNSGPGPLTTPPPGPPGVRGQEAEVTGLAIEMFSHKQHRYWAARALDPWVVSTLIQGYRLQFQHWPGQNDIYQRLVVLALVLDQELSVLLGKGAIEVVDPLLHPRWFYSTYFLVAKCKIWTESSLNDYERGLLHSASGITIRLFSLCLALYVLNSRVHSIRLAPWNYHNTWSGPQAQFVTIMASYRI